MASLFEETARSTILRRLDQLTPDATPRWGRMRPPEMLAHQEETLRYALREIDAAPVASPPMYADNTAATASSEVPNTRENCRIQAV